MPKFVFFGDSITDAGRNREDFNLNSYGYGFVRSLAGKLFIENSKNVIYNRGISGDRIVDLYARVKRDVWNLMPDVLTILIGVNDVAHEMIIGNGVDIARYENIYRLTLKETIERLPCAKIILMEPFVLPADNPTEWYEKVVEVKEYAKVVDKLAKEFNLPIVKLQEKLDSLSKIDGDKFYLFDGVHPSIAGAEIIAQEWYKVYEENVKL